MAQETPNYPAFREADSKAKLDASAKRIERADRASEQRAKKPKEVESKGPVPTYKPIEFDVKPAVPLQSDPDSQGDSYYRRKNVTDVTQTPKPTPSERVEYENAQFNFTMDNLRHDLSILGPLVEHFKNRYLSAMAVVIRIEDPNYDQAKTYADPKLERPQEVVESMGRKEAEIRNSSPFAKDIFGRIDESLKRELIKLGIVGEGENIDKLFERTSKYVEKSKEIVALDDKNRELQKEDSDAEMDKMGRRLKRKESSSTLTTELETAKAAVTKLEENIAFMGNGDPKLLTLSRFMVSDRLDAARANVERIQKEIKSEDKDYVEKKAPEPGRENDNEEVSSNNKKIKRLQDKLTDDPTQYNKYHVKNPDASWDSESNKVKVVEVKHTDSLVADGDSETRPAVELAIEPIGVPVLTGEVLTGTTEAPLKDPSIALFKAEYEQSGYVSPDMIKYPEEVEQLRENVESLEDITDDITAKKRELKRLDAQIASKRNKSTDTSLDVEDGNTEGAYDAGVLFNQMSSNGDSKLEEEDPEIKSLEQKRAQILEDISSREANKEYVMEGMNLPADQLNEYMRLGIHLGQAMTKAEKINSEISFAKKELEDIATSELAKKIGLEQTEKAKAGFMSVLELERASAIATVNQISERMMAITANTTSGENDNRTDNHSEPVNKDVMDAVTYERLVDAIKSELGEKLDVNLALPEGTVKIFNEVNNNVQTIGEKREEIELVRKTINELKKQREQVLASIDGFRTKATINIDTSLDGEDSEEETLLVRTNNDSKTVVEDGQKDAELVKLETDLGFIETAIKNKENEMVGMNESLNQTLTQLGLDTESAKSFEANGDALNDLILQLQIINTRVHFVEDKINSDKLNETLGLTLSKQAQIQMLNILRKDRETIFESVASSVEEFRKILKLPEVKPFEAKTGVPIKIIDANDNKSEAKKKITIGLIVGEIKSFLSKTIGKEAPKSTKTDRIIIALALLGAVVFGASRIASGGMFIDNILSNGKNPAGPLPNSLPVKPNTDNSTVKPETALPPVAAFTKAITDAAKSNAEVLPEVNLELDDSKKALDSNPANPSVLVQPASVITSPVTVTQAAVVPAQPDKLVVEAVKPIRKLAPVTLEKGSSLSAEYHKRGEFVDVKDWSNPRAMEMVSQMVVDNINNPSFWDALFDQNPDLLDDPVFKELVKKAQSKDFSEKDRKDIFDTIKGVFIAEKLTAEEIAQSLGISNVPEKSVWFMLDEK